MKYSYRAFVVRLIAAFALCLGVGLPLAAQTQAAPQATPGALPVIKTESRLVLVDAVVTDKKGTYIPDLKQQEFRVWEDDKEQEIKSFSLASAAPDFQDKPRYMVVLFDNSNVADADQQRLREAVAKFVEQNAGPKSYVAILDYGKTIEVAQNFTTDAAHLKDVVLHDKFASVSTNRDPTRIANAKGAEVNANAEGDYGVRTLLLGIRGLARRMAALPGRKSMVLLSSGFLMGPRLQADLAAATDACNKANVAIYPVALRGLTNEVSAETYVGNASTETMTIGRNTTIVVGAPSHPGMGPSQGTRNATANEQVLQSLANATGGFVIENAGDLLARMDQVAKEQRDYYIVGYTPPASAEDACHDIKVKVERANAFVRARSGYCNVKAADPLAGKPVAKQLEAWAGGESHGNITASMRAPYFYASPNVARVELAVEIPPGAVTFTKQKKSYTASIDVLGIAYKPDGTVGVRFSDSVPIEVTDQKVVDAFSKNPVPYTHEFEAAPGTYNLKVVLTTGKDSFANLQVPLVIDPYDGKQIAISGIALSKEVHPAPKDADLLDSAALEDRTPLVSHGYEFVPSATDRFKKGGGGAFYFEIYDPLLLGTNPPQVQMELKIVDSKTGTAKVDASGAIPDVKPGSPVVPLGMKIPLDGLPPGNYRLELKAMDSAGNTTPTREMAFQVD